MSVFKILIICVLLFGILLWYHNKSINDVMDQERKAYFRMKSEYELDADRKAIEKCSAQIEERVKHQVSLIEIKHKIDMDGMQKALDYFTNGLTIEQVEGKFYKEGYLDGYRDAKEGNEPEIVPEDLYEQISN